VRRRRPRERQTADQRVDPALAPGDPRPRRHLRPIDLQHLPGPIARALRGPNLSRPQHRHPLADEVNRAAIAVVIAQDLGHARRLDDRPVGQQPADHRLQRIEHRARRRTLVARRLARLGQPLDRPPVDPQPPRDLALRHTVGRHRPHLRPLHRAAHLLAASPRARIDDLEALDGTGQHRPAGWRTFQFLELAQYWAPGVRRQVAQRLQAGATGCNKLSGADFERPRPGHDRGRWGAGAAAGAGPGLSRPGGEVPADG
jgi:hypothetical protein